MDRMLHVWRLGRICPVWARVDIAMDSGIVTCFVWCYGFTVCDADCWAVFYLCNVVAVLFGGWMNIAGWCSWIGYCLGHKGRWWDCSRMICKLLEVIIAITNTYYPGQSGAWFWKPVASEWISVHGFCCGGCVLMIHGGLPAFWTFVRGETVGLAVAFFSGLLLSSSSSYFSSSSSSTPAFISLWFLVWLVLVIMVLWFVWRFLLVGSLVVGLVRRWGRLLVRNRGGRECRVILVLVSWMLLNGLRSVVQLILQVSYLRGKVLENIFMWVFCWVAWASCWMCWFIWVAAATSGFL